MALDLTQTYRVQRGQVVPTSWNGQAGHANPRCLGPTACRNRSGSSGAVCIDLDLRFLDVIAVIQTIHAAHPAVPALFNSPNLFGHTVRFYQYTAGKPPVWAIVMKSPFPDRAEVPVLEFFRPALCMSYTSVHDMQARHGFLEPSPMGGCGGQSPNDGMREFRGYLKYCLAN